MAKSVSIIGSGFAGLSAASFMAKKGWQVTVIEKNSSPGGRAAQLKEAGFTFDMGPSFYWMPDVFERYFNQFGKKAADFRNTKEDDYQIKVRALEDQRQVRFLSALDGVNDRHLDVRARRRWRG